MLQHLQVQRSTRAADSIACACGWEGYEAKARKPIRQAAAALAPLWHSDAASPGLWEDEEEQQQQQQVPPGGIDVQHIPPELASVLQSIELPSLEQFSLSLEHAPMPGLLGAGALFADVLPSGSRQLPGGAFTPEATTAAATTPIGTFGAADIMATLLQQAEETATAASTDEAQQGANKRQKRD